MRFGQALAALILWICAAMAASAAPVAGVVAQLSGPMTARGADGALRPLALKSEVAGGDTLLTGSGAYALVRFIDNSELTLRPDTSVKIDQFSFQDARPEQDSAAFTLIKGGLRSVTGLLGKRSKEKYAMQTPSATIGIRGTTFFLEYIVAAGEAAASPGLDPGLHVHVSEGGISLVNEVGAFQYDPGQFGYIKDMRTKPVKMFANPGMRFTPPASFGAGEALR
jgi:hypothetical protein